MDLPTFTTIFYGLISIFENYILSIALFQILIKRIFIKGPQTLTTSVLSSAANESIGASSYLMPAPQHSHVGTLRRSLLPTSMMGEPALPFANESTTSNSVVGIPTSSNIYYDSTIPRHFARGLTNDDSSYFYG